MRSPSRWYLIVALVPLIACGASWPLIDADRWSGLGQWVGGIGTLWAVLFALHTFTAERRKAEDERLDREMAQARLVTVHLRHPDPGEDRDVPIGFIVNNHSAFPILDLMLEGLEPINGLEFEWGFDTDVYEYWGPPPVVKPGEQNGAPIWFRPIGQPEVGGPGVRPIGDPDPKPIISFTDAEGRRWRRVGAGTPERVLPSITTA